MSSGVVLPQVCITDILNKIYRPPRMRRKMSSGVVLPQVCITDKLNKIYRPPRMRRIKTLDVPTQVDVINNQTTIYLPPHKRTKTLVRSRSNLKMNELYAVSPIFLKSPSFTLVLLPNYIMEKIKLITSQRLILNY
jgi:hypothetical protein